MASDSNQPVQPRIDPRSLKPSETCRLLNSTPLGEVINERQLHRHRTRAGFRIAGRVGEVFLGYGLARTDAAGVVALATRLAAAEHPAVLSVGVKPGSIWSVGQRPMTAVLAKHARLDSGGLVLSLGTVFPASGMVEVKPDEWLTVTDAAKLLMQDLPWLTLERARARVSRAGGKDSKFTTNGIKGGKHRIEPNSFDSWRLKQRDLDLAKDDSNL